MRTFWLLCGLLSLALGIAGIFLPLLPTTPFLLLSAWLFAKSSERLHLWLTEHRHLGKPIRDWQETGSISRRAKILAMIAIALTFAISLALGVSVALLAVQGAILGAVSVFILTRPDSG